MQLTTPAFILDRIIELRVEISERVLGSEEGCRLTCIRLSGIERVNANNGPLKRPAGTCIKVVIACRSAIRLQEKKTLCSGSLPPPHLSALEAGASFPMLICEGFFHRKEQT